MNNEALATATGDDRARGRKGGAIVSTAPKHTPGPWRVTRGNSQMSDKGTTIWHRECAGVYSDAYTHGDADADALLIAAAPDLLEAIQAVLQIDANGVSLKDRLKSWNAGRPALEKAEAAISKATGEEANDDQAKLFRAPKRLRQGQTMDKCTRCGSYAVNPGRSGRDESSDLDLCDVCYWRKRAEQAVANEREACAAMVQGWDTAMTDKLATAIRDRGARGGEKC